MSGPGSGTGRGRAQADDDRLAAARAFYARLAAAAGDGVRERLERAFEMVPRELFLGPGPWLAVPPAGGGLIETPDADPIHVYQDLLFVLDRDKGINNGEPCLHGQMMGALDPDRGDAALHIGCGTGYYSAILAHLVGPQGHVRAYEIEPELARRARICLEPWDNVEVIEGSGAAGPLPEADAIYVNAGTTRPHTAWLDALRDGGRLVFPLGGSRLNGAGVTLLVRRHGDQFGARVLGYSRFIACVETGRDTADRDASSERFAEAFSSGAIWAARSLIRDDAPDETAVLAGEGWWLSSRGDSSYAERS